MSFSFKAFLQGAEKITLKEAPEIASAFNPALGAIVQVTANAINAAQVTGATPADKKTQVMNSLEAAAPAIAPLLSSAGINVTDPSKFSAGASNLVEAVLDMMKGTGTLAPAVAASSPVTPIQTSPFPPTPPAIPVGPITCTLVSAARQPNALSLILNIGGL